MNDTWNEYTVAAEPHRQEVDRLYHINQTSGGRINCITDYIMCVLAAKDNELAALRARVAELEAQIAGVRICAHPNLMPLSYSHICPDCHKSV